jgi:hypothetical protein
MQARRERWTCSMWLRQSLDDDWIVTRRKGVAPTLKPSNA